MRVKYKEEIWKILENVPPAIKKAFFKQASLLELNLRHPSLRAKKYNESQDLWQARVTQGWRFYFVIKNDTYIIVQLIPHPK